MVEEGLDKSKASKVAPQPTLDLYTLLGHLPARLFFRHASKECKFLACVH